jgi:hypothetical protein
VADALGSLAALQAAMEQAARDAGLEASIAREVTASAVDQVRRLFGGERVYVPTVDPAVIAERHGRDAHALAAHRAGASLREIGARLGISKSEAFRAIVRAQGREGLAG